MKVYKIVDNQTKVLKINQIIHKLFFKSHDHKQNQTYIHTFTPKCIITHANLQEKFNMIQVKCKHTCSIT